MREFVLLILATLMMLAGAACRKDVCECRCPEPEETLPAGEEPEEEPEDDPEEPEIIAVPEFNIVAAEYPDGYDWLRDPDHGAVGCDICLLQDGVEKLRFPAGNEYMVSADIDMVRCIGEDVFTDFSTSSETIIMKNGTELFRYPGREMIRGVAEVEGKGVYTLGVPREGFGWILRCDGEAAAVSDIGEIVSGLVSDADETAFAYATADGRYYQVRDGRKSGLNVSPSGADVVAVKFCGGEASVYTLDEENVLRKDGMELLTFGDSFRLLAVYPDGEHTGAVGYYGDDIYTQYMFLDGEYTEFPENYCLAAVSTGAFSNGHYCLCLNPVEAGLPPLYIRDGETVRLPFNGCFLGLGVSLAYETVAP